MRSEPLAFIDPESYEAACEITEGCSTCGDVALAVTVLEIDRFDARCEDPQGKRTIVGVDLVWPVEAGDRLLVHAGVAISRLEGSP